MKKTFVISILLCGLSMVLGGCRKEIKEEAVKVPDWAKSKETEDVEPASEPIEDFVWDDPTPLDEGLKNDSDFKLIGYLPDWYDISVVDKVHIGKYTHINYAFAIPDKEGNIRPNFNDDYVEKIIKLAHENHVMVMLSVGGWSYENIPLEDTFAKATATEEGCHKLANSILQVVQKYNFDGVDLDWEYPRPSTRSQYDMLVNYLYTALSVKNMPLTAAVASGTGNGFSDETLAKLDWVNVMAYDGDEGAGHSPMSFAVDSVNYWTMERGMDKSKVNLGVPFYERPNWASYADIINADPENAYKDETVINGKTVYYNGINLMKEKTDWAMENAGGIMIWEITQDTDNEELSLLNTILDVMRTM